MACALLFIVVAAVAVPLSFDGAVDAQVALDLIDLPFSIDESLLGELLEQDHAGSIASKADLGLLQDTFRLNLTGAGSSEANRPKRRPWGGDQVLKLARSRKPLVWVHLHKAGGTLMCYLAELNEKVVSTRHNCNWEGHDGWEESGRPSVRKSCSERAKMFHKNGYTYGQIEREMDDDELCDKFRYGIMFREPLALMQSIVNYELWYQRKVGHTAYSQPFLEFPDDVAKWLEGKIEAGAVPGSELAPWAWLDNFQTRLVANAFDVPVGQITEDHLARARAFLRKNKFMVQVLEDLPTQGERLFNKLGWTMGWRNGILKAKKNSFQDMLRKHALNTTDRADRAVPRPFTAEELDYLRDLNRYDLELYNGVRDPSSEQPAEQPAEQPGSVAKTASDAAGRRTASFLRKQ